MRYLARLALGVGLALATTSVVPVVPAIAQSFPHSWQGQHTFVRRAVFADGQLWVLTSRAGLWSLTEAEPDPTSVAIPEPALDLWVQDGQPAVISCGSMNCAEWVLRRRDGDGAWKTTARVPTQGDDLVAAASTGAGTMVLTRGRVIAGTPISEASRDLIVHRGLVIALAENKQTAAPLSQFLYAKPVAATHATPTAVFVGFDKGEWGGGLQRIDRQTGAVVSIEQKDWGQPCYGPLDSACDPVNGIATAPWDPGCVVATIGLLHGMGRGRIVEVCDGVVRRLYVKASSRYGRVGKKAPAAGSSDPDPNPSVAFFGLVRTGDVLWAAGDDGLYQIRADRTVHAMPLPAFTRVGDISVSFDLPELILVLTNIEKSRIGAGAVPLLVPR